MLTLRLRLHLPPCSTGAEIDESPWEVQYAVAFYWACMTVTTIGYGDVVCSIQVQVGTMHVSKKAFKLGLH
jgi:hypothetical protein